MTLGFDASSTVCGWAFYDGTVITDAGFVDISKYPTNKEKVLQIISVMDAHPLIKQVDTINLEASLSGFMRGRTSQQVVIMLARFNAIFEYIVSEHFKITVNLVNASSARKYVLGKSFIKGIKPKDYVKQELPKLHPEVLKFDKLNRNNEWNVKNSDMYDAVIIAIYKK
jgi:hypothetical protein